MRRNYRDNLKNYREFYKCNTPQEKVIFLLRYAVLAPSTHNTQPWLFKIGNNCCDLFINKRKKLVKADPSERDLYISMGCCLENLIIASKFYGVYKSHKLLNKNRGDYVARVNFKKLNRKDNYYVNDKHLMNSIVERINVRGLFSKKKIEEKHINKVKVINKNKNIKLYLVDDKQKKERLAKLTADGLRTAHSDKEFRQEMSNWINSSLIKKKEGIPTYSLRVPFFLSIFFPILIRNFNMGNKLSRLNYISMKSAPLVIVIAARKENVKVWIEIGQLAQKIMLELSANRISTSIFLAAIEMGELYKEVMKVLKSKYRPQFLFCVGYMKIAQGFTPRISAEEKLI